MSKTEQKLQHLAIIMDGNGRWASIKGLPRSFGHKKGAEVVEKIARAANELGVKYLTLYAFSTENWNRPKEEVDTLMGLLRQYLKNDLKEIQKNNVRIRFIGERYMLDQDLQDKMAEIEAQTIDNSALTLCIAISYGGRLEILAGVKKISNLLKNGTISEDEVDIKMFSDMLYTNDMPDPDLLIRTGGEKRISNYLLWQLAYSELYFSDILWPDFDQTALENIINDYQLRDRRYGKI